jgi:hypothetical protein
MINTNRVRRRISGQVLLEFAIGLPLLLTLLFFVAEAGYFLIASQAVPTALHDAAILAVSRSTEGVFQKTDTGLLKAAILKSMSRPGIVNATSAVDLMMFGNSDKRRTRVILKAEAEYVGITPLRKMFSNRTLGGKMVVPIGDWSGQE